MSFAWLWWIGTALAAVEHKGNFLPGETSVLDRLLSLVGIFVFIGLAWLLSEKKKDVRWRPVVWGVVLQLIFGAVVLSPALSAFFFTVVNTGVNQLLAFSGEGATFVFQSVEPHTITVGSVPDLLAGDGTPTLFVGTGSGISPPVKTFAFWILPTIVFFSSLMSVLYYLGIMQVIVKGIAKAMVYTLGTSGAESLSCAGNIFVGQTEAPLLIRPFVADMTRSELMAVMTGGFATVAGGVMGAYVGFLQDIPNIAGHLVVASIISAPAALAISKIMVPETEQSRTAGTVNVEFEKNASNLMEAAANGAADGMKLAINVAAMLMAIVALVAMFDWCITWMPVTFCDSGAVPGYGCVGPAPQGVALATYRLADGSMPGAGDWFMLDGVRYVIVDMAQGLVRSPGTPLSLAMILGWVFAPIALVMGVPWGESLVVGRLLGEKIVLTEFIAYINLGGLIHAETPVLSERSAIIASYALCGFANFASIGIQLGGIGGIAPNQMGTLASLGFKAMIAGVIAACMTGSIAGIML